LLHEVDVERLRGMRAQLDALFARGVVHGALERSGRGGSPTLEVALPAAASIAIVDLREDITAGQSVARYSVSGSNGGDWFPVSRGTTIGYRKLDRIEPVTVTRLRLTIEESMGSPVGMELRAFTGSASRPPGIE
jgi:alpha-L-fucosidase